MAIQMMEYDAEGKRVPKISHEGCVISLGEHNYYDDSDFYAVVWIPENKCVQEIEYATTRAGCDGYYAWVDFDKEKYGEDYAHYRRKLQFYYEADISFFLQPMSLLFKVSPDKGKPIEVFRGKKVPIGTKGIIFSSKNNPYDDKNPLIMIKTEDGQYLRTYMRNVAPILPSREQMENLWKEMVGEIDEDFEKVFTRKIEYYTEMVNCWKMR